MSQQGSDLENRICQITHELLIEAGVATQYQQISFHAALHHLGVDSLSRIELFHRIEKYFQVKLPDKALAQINKLSDFVQWLSAARLDEPKEIIQQQVVATPITHSVNPEQFQTLQEVLLGYAKATPERVHLYYHDENGLAETITYEALANKALRFAAALQKRGVQPKQTIALMLPSHPSFFYAFLGTLLAGCIPVPIYPLAHPSQLENYIKKESKMLNNAKITALISFYEARQISALLKSFVNTLQWSDTAENLLKESTEPAVLIHTGKSSDSALIQYTSGSTNDPKGVLLTHSNLLSNIRAYGHALQIKPEDIAVNWLPLYHDLGLIGMWLGSLYHGTALVLMSPLTFLMRPEKWLWAMHDYKATISAAPNFGYDLCVKRIDDSKLKNLDLSHWRVAVNGAEPVQIKTLQQFSDRFAPYGFKSTTHLPVYGLAETSLGLTTPPLNRGVKVDYINRTTFERERQAIPVSPEEKFALQVVSCGSPLINHEIRIVNDQNEIVSERRVGSVQFRGPSSLQCYYDRPEATAAIYHDGWWETGDLGYLADGELYLTGRQKDLIIKAGSNYYPSEIEQAVSEVEGIRKGCVIAFGVSHTDVGTEKIIVAAEVNKLSDMKNNELHRTIQTNVLNQIGIAIDEIVLLAPRSIPKTTSGKLQRAQCKKAYLAKTLQRKKSSVGLQVVKLSFQATVGRSKKMINQMRTVMFAVYSGLFAASTALMVWMLLFVLPRKVGQQLIQGWIKSLSYCLGMPISVKGIENLPKQGPAILAVNHSSYIDPLPLIASLPLSVYFVGKHSAFKVPFLRKFLKVINHFAIDKHDMQKSESELMRLSELLKKGEMILAFPEGTFTAANVPLPFKLGIFKLAAEMNAPIYPIKMEGTREIMPRNRFWFKRHAVQVRIGKPCFAVGNDWQAINQLKNEVREIMFD